MANCALSDCYNRHITGREIFAYVNPLSSFRLFLTSNTGRNRDRTRDRGCYYVTGGHDSPRGGGATPEMLFGSKYFIVRAIADTEVRSGPKIPSWYLTGRQTGRGVDAHRRIAEDFYATIIDIVPN